ncbi:MAG: hypothetical protein WKG52_08720 [Variovorax sp.]
MAHFEQLARLRRRQANLLAAVQAEAPDGMHRALLANVVGLLSQTAGPPLACWAMRSCTGTQPELARAVVSQPGLLDALVQEVGRHDPPIKNTRRFVAEAVTIAGTAPRRAMPPLLGAANRDPPLTRRRPGGTARAARNTLGYGAPTPAGRCVQRGGRRSAGADRARPGRRKRAAKTRLALSALGERAHSRFSLTTPKELACTP